MSGNISMTPERMRERSSEVKQQGEDYQAIVDRMQVIINELQVEWEGEASREFNNQFNDLKPHLAEMRELFEALSLQLTQTVDAMEELDASRANSFRAR